MAGNKNRHREKPDRKSGKEKGPLFTDQFVLTTLHTLDELERKTRSGNDAHGKDRAAFQALMYASWLVKYVAGWAIDHQRGLAEAGLQFVPRGAKKTMSSPSYLAKRSEVDTHIHEEIGSAGSKLDPSQLRLFAFNVLRPMHHLGLPQQLLEGLEALDYGQTLPILTKAETKKRMGLIEYRAKLAAVCYIEHQYARGTKKLISIEDVAAAFQVSREAVKDWNTEVRGALGDYEVERMITLSRNMGTNTRTMHADSSLIRAADEKVGKAAMLKAAERFKARARKAAPIKPARQRT
jgi:hypothetical protein